MWSGIRNRVKFCPNCGEDCVSQDTGIPVKESVDKTKSAINDFGENMQKKEVENFQGKKISTCSRYLRLGRVSWQ